MSFPDFDEFKDSLRCCKSDNQCWGELFWCIANQIPCQREQEEPFVLSKIERCKDFIRQSGLLPVLAAWDIYYTKLADTIAQSRDAETWQLIEYIERVREDLDIQEQDLEITSDFLAHIALKQDLLSPLQNVAQPISLDDVGESSPSGAPSQLHQSPMSSDSGIALHSPATSPAADASAEPESHAVPTVSAESTATVKQTHPEQQPIAHAQPRSLPLAALQGESLSSQLPSPPKNALITGIVVAGGLAILAALISNRQLPQAPLSWQSSCGSPPVSGSSWWPVLGPADALDTVRSRYCGDAYLTAEGASQVASFSSVEEATAFARRLADATGYSFRVGQQRTP